MRPRIKNLRVLFFGGNFLAVKLLILSLVLLAGNTLHAQTTDELVKNGNKAYQSENYQAAIESYQKILGQGFESGALYYNLGNSYFKSGKIGYAIYCYEKGLKLEPNDEDLSYNLKIANSRTVDKISELPKLFIVSWWEGLVTSLGVTGWSVVVMIIFWSLLASFAVYLMSGKINFQRIAFLSASVFLALFLMASILLFARVNRESATNYGILLESSYTVKVSPDVKSGDAFVIHEGIKFAIEDHLNEWVKIHLGDGKVGWIQKNVLGRI
jgi:tetratricopeptide (TPR) repeat protein